TPTSTPSAMVSLRRNRPQAASRLVSPGHAMSGCAFRIRRRSVVPDRGAPMTMIPSNAGSSFICARFGRVGHEERTEGCLEAGKGLEGLRAQEIVRNLDAEGRLEVEQEVDGRHGIQPQTSQRLRGWQGGVWLQEPEVRPQDRFELPRDLVV